MNQPWILGQNPSCVLCIILLWYWSLSANVLFRDFVSVSKDDIGFRDFFFSVSLKKKTALCISVLLHKKELKSFSTFSKSALEQFVQPWGYLVFEALVGFPCETLWAWIFLWSTFMITLFLLWELLYLNFLSNWISLGNYPLLTGFHIYLYRCL